MTETFFFIYPHIFLAIPPIFLKSTPIVLEYTPKKFAFHGKLFAFGAEKARQCDFVNSKIAKRCSPTAHPSMGYYNHKVEGSNPENLEK